MIWLGANVAITERTWLRLWQAAHDALEAAYRLAAKEAEQGLDRESTRRLVAAAENAEQRAWIAYRG